MARFTRGAANCGYCRASCLKPSSASKALPARMSFTARSKSERAAGVTCGCAAARGAAAAGGAAPVAGGRTGGSVAGGAVGRAAGGCPGRGAVRAGSELQAASAIGTSPASARAATRRACHAAGAAAPGGPLFEARDHILRQLRLAVARGLQLRERLKALAHPLVVHPVLGARGVQLVRLDRLLLERKYLLLEEGVVFLQRIALELRGPLRGQDVLGERAVQLRHLVAGGGRDPAARLLGGELVA